MRAIVACKRFSAKADSSTANFESSSIIWVSMHLDKLVLLKVLPSNYEKADPNLTTMQFYWV